MEYKNPSEKVFRRTLHPIQKIVVIVPADYRFEDDKTSEPEAGNLSCQADPTFQFDMDPGPDPDPTVQRSKAHFYFACTFIGASVIFSYCLKLYLKGVRRSKQINPK